MHCTDIKTMRVSVFKETQDNWCGSYNMNDWYEGRKNIMLVEVIFNGNITVNDPTRVPVWRTCVWGNDDCGMEFDCATETEAWNKFSQVIGMKYVNMVELRNLGFIGA